MKKKYLVAGLGRSGIEGAELLLGQGEEVVLYDGNAAFDLSALSGRPAANAKTVLGEYPMEGIPGITDLVLSPGISPELPWVTALKAGGVRLWSEIELAWQFERGTVLGITGTNGKTTTTSLVHAVMKAWKGEDKAFVGGNIGIPYASNVLKTSADSITTLELSSFQLENVRTFHPKAAAILNITPDHMNRHHTMEAYAAAKYEIARNEREGDVLILNRSDERLRAFGERPHRSRVVWFSGREALRDGYFLRGNELVEAKDGRETVRLRTEETTLVGQCNYENILAALAMADAVGVPEEITAEAVRNFRAVAHRIEYVGTVNGVRYYDDSKGTNPDAAIQGIRAMTGPTVLIGGGFDKGSEFGEWIREFGGKVKLLVLMGQTAEKIAETAKSLGFTAIRFVNSMEEAVEVSRKTAAPGENVLLSPACASWGMFKNYEERGDLFKELVCGMKGYEA